MFLALFAFTAVRAQDKGMAEFRSLLAGMRTETEAFANTLERAKTGREAAATVLT